LHLRARGAWSARARDDARVSLEPAAESYLGALAGRLHGALGDELLAIYLIGSAALGDYVPGASDLDVMVVCASPLSRPAKEALVSPLWQRSLSCPARGLELVVYAAAAVRAPGASVPFEVNLNTGPRMADHVSFDPAEESAHWFLLDVAIARQVARPLAGPPAAALLGPVAREHVLAALRLSLAWHAEHEGGGANTVLNACRAWLYVETDTWASKREAGRWAVAAGIEPALVEAALARHAGAAGAALEPAAVAALLARCAAALERAPASRPPRAAT
jgi:hypothetical protein